MKRAIGIGLFGVASFAVFWAEASVYGAFCTDGCGLPYPELLTEAVIALVVAAVFAIAGLERLVGQGLWMPVLASAFVVLIAGWGWVDYSLSRPLAVAGRNAAPGWLLPTGPVVLFSIGLILARWPPGRRRQFRYRRRR